VKIGSGTFENLKADHTSAPPLELFVSEIKTPAIAWLAAKIDILARAEQTQPRRVSRFLEDRNPRLRHGAEQ
jgi:hypothetical protein